MLSSILILKSYSICGVGYGFLWVGVQGVVAPEFIIRPNFLNRVVKKSHSGD
ncbi:hypothetical protein [Leptospira noguchii]|uniref:hypothetical protein n=1 Tax=Leptospira noguchii TaxID=28182 RepID=UPI00031ED2D4|nr:hypothetical protein [Leptospira noguchii]